MTADSFAPLRFRSEDASGASPCEEVTAHSVTRRRVTLLAPHSRTDTRIWLLPAGAALPRMRVQRMFLSCGMAGQRMRELLADGNDDIVLQIHLTGRRHVSQRGREAIAEPGGGIFISNAEESAVVVPGASRSIGIALSRPLMTALCPALDDALLRPVRSDVLRLLVRYLDVLEEENALATPELRHLVGMHIHDLCALALGAARDAADLAGARGLRAARMQAVKADIAQHLEGDVSPATLAQRQGVTPRYLHKLFEREGVTLSRFVLAQRLARVHRRLAAPSSADATISAIAYAAGFRDLSTFNREFRRQFGMTPSDVRAAAGRKEP